jgi:hypothetical protein
MFGAIQRGKNIASGVRTLSVTPYKGNSLRLGVNLKKGADVGPINRYRVEFNNRQNEAIINCLDYGLFFRLLFPRRIAELNTHIDALLNRKGYFSSW